MPSTINGIGTRYIGKRNVESAPGVCESCGNSVSLLTYETRLWFCVLYIPVIPLGRKQILDYCRSCTMHRAMPLQQWEELRQQSIAASSEELKDNRDDPDAGLKMLGTLAVFRKNDEATKLALLLKDRHPDHAEVQFHVGSWLEQVGRADDAAPRFQRAFEIEPDNLVYRRAWGITQAQQGQLNEARETLSVLEPPSEHYDLGTVIFLATRMQDAGDHGQSLDLFEKLLAATPDLAKNKDFRKLVKKSEQATAAETSLLPRQSLLGATWFRWTAAAVVVGASIVGTSMMFGMNQKVHVVNGSQVPITVLFDGTQEVVVPPLQFLPVTIGQGDHSWKLTSPEVLAGEGQFSVSTNPVSRFFQTACGVLDPAGTTITVFENATYAARADNARIHRRYYAGQSFVYFEDVDFVFEDLPEEIRSERNDMTRSRVGAVLIEPALVIGALSSEVPQTDLMTLAERHLKIAPTADGLLDMYTMLAARTGTYQRMADFLKQGVSRKPIEVDWHRSYQGAAHMMGRFQELIPEYDQLIAANPDDAAVYYLRGRIEPDGDRADVFYSQSIERDPNLRWPWFAKAYRLASLAQFAEAREAAERALQLEPDDADAQRIIYDLRQALGEADQLAAEARAALQQDTLSVVAHFRLLSALSLLGRGQEMQQQHNAFALAMRTSHAVDPFESVKHSERYLAWHNGDFERMLNITNSMVQNPQKQQLLRETLLEMGRVNDVEQGPWPEPLTQRAYARLQLSLACFAAQDAERAERWFNAALDDFRQGDAESGLIATAFDKTSGQELVDALHRISMQNDERLTVSLAAAMRSEGDARAQHVTLAERLNYSPTFPQKLARRVITQMQDAAAN